MADAGAGPEVGDVVAAAVTFVALVAVTGGARVDQTLIDGEQVVGVDAEAPARIRQQVGDEHVGAGHEVVEHLLAVGVRHVEPDAPLAAVHDLPHELDAHVALGEPSDRVAHHRVGDGGRHDLDHVGPPVGQHRRRRRRERVHRQLDDLHPFEHVVAHRRAGGRGGWSPRSCSGVGVGHVGQRLLEVRVVVRARGRRRGGSRPPTAGCRRGCRRGPSARSARRPGTRTRAARTAGSAACRPGPTARSPRSPRAGDRGTPSRPARRCRGSSPRRPRTG